MSRFKNLGAIFGLATNIVVKEKNDHTHECDIYRKEEWGKHCVAYNNLLASNTFYGNKRNELLTTGFTFIEGNEYNMGDNTGRFSATPLNLDKLVYDSIVRRPKMIWLPCMDERLQYLTASHHALSLGMPGCECLMNQEEKEKVANEIISVCEKNKTIEEIVVSSHSGCGAVAKAISDHKNEQSWFSRFIERFSSEDILVDKEGEKYALSFAQILEKLISQKQLSISVRTHHFAHKELHSQHLHNAFGAVVNLDPLLNTAEFEDSLELPMFNIYSGGQNAQQIVDNIILAIAIAAGTHGFSCDYLNKNTPFVLLFTSDLAKNTLSTDIISEVIKKLKQTTLKLDVVYKVLDTSN
jgi:carbonic anhydrase